MTLVRIARVYLISAFLIMWALLMAGAVLALVTGETSTTDLAGRLLIGAVLVGVSALPAYAYALSQP